MAILKKENEQSFQGIQALRFFAAMLVVATHATLMLDERHLNSGHEYWWQQGMWGVDVFFVISGFVMATSVRGLIASSNGWLIFLIKRIIRIVPMYWLATTAKIAIALALPSIMLRQEISFLHVFQSYFFIPIDDRLPILPVGWTLNYEMFFYVVFSIALFFGRPPIKFCALVLGACAMLGFVPGLVPSLIAGFFNPIILEFIMGAVLAQNLWRLKALGWLGIPLIAIAACLVFFAEPANNKLRVIFWGIPAMLMVLGVLLIEPFVKGRIPKILLSLGDSSYSLYLVHTFVVPAVGIIYIGKFGGSDALLAILAAFVLSIVVSHAVHLLVERRIGSYLARFVPRVRRTSMNEAKDAPLKRTG